MNIYVAKIERRRIIKVKSKVDNGMVIYSMRDVLLSSIKCESFHIKEQDAYEALANYMNDIKINWNLHGHEWVNDDYCNCRAFDNGAIKFHLNVGTNKEGVEIDLFAIVKEIEVN